ncbi:uncharacterized protein VP01_552g3 [Puccinia sorghi]|uniref:Uncharacterized protein n=1 Tax=Puccinia sorghi TaxID=27349 RepID=A0A0L6UJA2_9BASI|nr:uncharacterized protein VP01_552g3 [Puccinia sorghi]
MIIRYSQAQSANACFGRQAMVGILYSMSKAAITHLTKILATHLSSTNIRVNAIAPGLCESLPIYSPFMKAKKRGGIAKIFLCLRKQTSILPFSSQCIDQLFYQNKVSGRFVFAFVSIVQPIIRKYLFQNNTMKKNTKSVKKSRPGKSRATHDLRIL